VEGKSFLAGARWPSLAWNWAPVVQDLLQAEPRLKTAEVYRRLRLQGYPGGKSSFYPLVALCRLRITPNAGSSLPK